MKYLEYKGRVIRDIEKRFNTSIEELLHQLYIIDMKSAQEIAEILDTSHVTVNKYLLRMGIKRRFDWREIVEDAKSRGV